MQSTVKKRGNGAIQAMAVKSVNHKKNMRQCRKAMDINNQQNDSRKLEPRLNISNKTSYKKEPHKLEHLATTEGQGLV